MATRAYLCSPRYVPDPGTKGPMRLLQMIHLFKLVQFKIEQLFGNNDHLSVSTVRDADVPFL